MSTKDYQAITYEHVVSCTSNGVIATDEDGRVVLINQEALNALGIDKQHKKENNHKLIHLLTKLVGACLQTGGAQIGQHVDWNGDQFVVNVTPINNQDRLLGTVINFQRRHQFEASAKKLQSFIQVNKQLETIIASSSDGLWVSDGDGRIISINKASEQLNDIWAADYVGKNLPTSQKELVEVKLQEVDGEEDVVFIEEA